MAMKKISRVPLILNKVLVQVIREFYCEVAARFLVGVT